MSMSVAILSDFTKCCAVESAKTLTQRQVSELREKRNIAPELFNIWSSHWIKAGSRCVTLENMSVLIDSN